MRRNKNKNGKRKFYLLILLLLVLSLGMAYAYLTQQLSINNTINYGSMKWDVGFVSVDDYSDELIELFGDDNEMAGMLFPVETSLSSDKKSINLTADFGTDTSSKIIYVAATIQNNSTFDVYLTDYRYVDTSDDLLNFLNNYVDSTRTYWFDTLEEGPTGQVAKGNILKAGESKNILIYCEFYEIDEYNLPTSGLSIDFSVLMEWEELSGDLSPFSVTTGGGTRQYLAEKDMTWEEWVDSEYNIDEFIVSNGIIKTVNSCSAISDINGRVSYTDTIIAGYSYNIPDC